MPPGRASRLLTLFCGAFCTAMAFVIPYRRHSVLITIGVVSTVIVANAMLAGRRPFVVVDRILDEPSR